MAGTIHRRQVTCGTGLGLELIGRLSCQGAWRGQNHRHAFWELLWYDGGAGEFRGGGRRFPVRPGSCFLVPPGMLHQLLVEDGIRHLYVGFTWQGRAPSEQRLAALPEVPPEPGADLQRTLGALWLRGDAGIDRPEAVAELLPGLFALLQWLQDGAASDPLDAHHTHVRHAQAYLAANLHRMVTVREVARSCYLSPGHLATIFGRGTGMTIKAWHAELRLQRAGELLRQSGEDIAQIARSLGFGQPAYFTRLFTRRFGEPPSRYRSRA